MPQDDIYWNSISFGSEESLNEPVSKPYIDPWDLENYAYIRNHIDSMESTSSPSSGEFVAEQNSTSFHYVPGNMIAHENITLASRNNASGNTRKVSRMEINQRLQKYDSYMPESGNYAAIDEVKVYDRRPRIPVAQPRRVRSHMSDDFESDESPYEESPADASLYVYERNNVYKKSEVPTPRDRSMSFSYGDTAYDPYSLRHEIYSKLEEIPIKKDSTLPLYDDARSLRSKKPRNFGLSNYGHLKIDYSYSWNNLNKYICK